MAARDEARSLRRIAARVLNRNVKDGLDELDHITAAIDAAIRWRFILSASLCCFFTLIFSLALIVWVEEELSGRTSGNAGLAFLALLAAAALAPLLYWRGYQYGLAPFGPPKPGFYAGASKASVDALEKLFTYLQQETSPQPFVFRANNSKRYLDRRQFFGTLRALAFSKYAGIRSGCLPPYGLWQSKMIYLDADADEIMAAINAKPKAGGRKKEFDYATILLRLIGHPALSAIDLDAHGSTSKIMNLIRDVCAADDDDPVEISVPEETTLRQFAKEIEAALKKNRLQGK
jgi:hypothetical protein